MLKVNPNIEQDINYPRFSSKEHDFGFDCMEVSVYRG
jgi:hypothetical protein